MNTIILVLVLLFIPVFVINVLCILCIILFDLFILLNRSLGLEYFVKFWKARKEEFCVWTICINIWNEDEEEYTYRHSNSILHYSHHKEC